MSKCEEGTVVITYNSAAFVEACLGSLPHSEASIVVVDNASSDATLKIVREKYPQVRIIANERNRGYSAAVNQGAALMQSDIFVIANADVEFGGDSYRRLTDFIRQHPDAGVVGPQLVFPDGSWQGSYCDLPGILDATKRLMGWASFQNWSRRLLWPRKVDRKPKNVDCLVGAAIAVRREAFSAIGGFDEDFHFYCEDADFCIRLRNAGWRVMLFPDAEVMHVAGASSTRVDVSDKYFRLLVESKLLLLKKNIPAWQIQICKQLEKLHSLEMLMGWRLAQRIGRSAPESNTSAKAIMFERMVQIWTVECRKKD